MNTTKCAHCGLVNFSADTVCERCGTALEEKDSVSMKVITSSHAIPLINCPACKAEVSSQATSCPRCGQPISGQGRGHAPHQPVKDVASLISSDSHKLMLGLVGSAMLFVGVFTPMFSAPFMGSINYFHNGDGLGVVIIAMAVMSVFAMLIKQYKVLLLTGILSLGTLGYTFIDFNSKMSDLRAEMRSGFGNAILNTIQLQWGWAFLVLGAVILVIIGASAFLLEKASPQGDFKSL